MLWASWMVCVVGSSHIFSFPPFPFSYGNQLKLTQFIALKADLFSNYTRFLNTLLFLSHGQVSKLFVGVNTTPIHAESDQLRAVQWTGVSFVGYTHLIIYWSLKLYNNFTDQVYVVLFWRNDYLKGTIDRKCLLST